MVFCFLCCGMAKGHHKTTDACPKSKQTNMHGRMNDALNHRYASRCKSNTELNSLEITDSSISDESVTDLDLMDNLLRYETSSPQPDSRVSFGNAEGFIPEMNLAKDLFTRGLDHDLISPLPIYNLWKRKFGTDEDSVQLNWRQCCESALKNYYTFSDKLKSLEGIVHTALTIENIHQKESDIDILLDQVESLDNEISEVTQTLQNMANYIPQGVHRNNIKQRIQSLRRRYFSFLKELNRKKEILRQVAPRMERRLYQEKEIKTWLDLAETRLCDIPDYYNIKLLMEKHKVIEHVAKEMESKFDIYAKYIDTCKSILHFLDFNDLSMELQDVSDRWDQLSSNMDDLLCKVEMYKERPELTCFSDFKIINDNESWKILTNKEVRLVRLHGNTIVVRVGGGWEYLYDFLLRVDPDRAKYLSGNDGQAIDAIGLRGLYLSPTEKKQIREFTLSVERKMWKSWTSVADIPLSQSSDEDSGILCESK